MSLLLKLVSFRPDLIKIEVSSFRACLYYSQLCLLFLLLVVPMLQDRNRDSGYGATPIEGPTSVATPVMNSKRGTHGLPAYIP